MANQPHGDETQIDVRRALPATFNRVLITAGFLLYAVVLFFAASRWKLPSIGWRAVGFLALAVVSEFIAKVFFALLFKDALHRQGHDVTLKASIYASLIGSAVARLLPAGGALTPTAMAWAVRTEDDETAGAALRATMTSYGGLLLLTGVALGWGASTGRHPLLFTGAVVVGVLLTGAGLFILIGSRWLGAAISRLPERLRRHFGPTGDVGRITPREIALIVARIVLEATVLWAALRAFGIDLTPSQAMVAFGVSTVVGGLPASPGGIGLVEGGLVGVLAGLRFPTGLVVAPVLVYRIIDYWLAAGVGILAAGRMNRHSTVPERRRSTI
ncbi:MAG: flippase-like domain-containing protein [Acidimicrobiia bacterium]|nr:flippase-like domain-containing protein [Acidimicrobiia bacterium]